MKLTIKNILIFFAALLLISVSIIGFEFWSFLNTPLIAAEATPTTFIFAQGTPVKKLAHSLKQRNLLEHPLLFVVFVRLQGVEFNLKAGEYVIEPDTTPIKLVHKMVKGEVLRHAFTIVEGWTFAQVIAALNSNQYVTHTIKDLQASKIMEIIGHQGEFPEGRFAPDTYTFSGNTTDVNLLSRAYLLMQKKLQTAWNNRAKELSYHCPYEVLIVASLVEKETAVNQEKPIIADIILRRLAKGMLLQVDPSVIYGLGEKFSGKLTRNELARNTPYNTYLHKGLPPTPISMPSQETIEAVLHPVANPYWYYVSRGDGAHEFSISLKKQVSAINKYLLVAGLDKINRLKRRHKVAK